MRFAFHEYAPAAKRHLFRGRYMTAKEIAAALGLTYSAITYRIRKGLPLDMPNSASKGGKPHVYMFRGEHLTAKQIASRLGVGRTTVRNRILEGRYVEDDELATMPCERGSHERILFHHGRAMNLSEWAREAGINVFTLLHRLNAGWSMQDALTKPVMNMTLRTTRVRNRKIIRRIAFTFSRDVNEIGLFINLNGPLTSPDMVNEPSTGGYPTTSPLLKGTGGPRHARHADHSCAPDAHTRALPSPAETRA